MNFARLDGQRRDPFAGRQHGQRLVSLVEERLQFREIHGRNSRTKRLRSSGESESQPERTCDCPKAFSVEASSVGGVCMMIRD